MSTKSKKNAPVQPDDFNFDVPEDYGQAVGNTLNEGIQLPFFAPFLSFNNGSAAFKKISLPAYTGAWSMFTEQMDVMAADIGHVHSGFELVEGLSSKKGEYSAYMAQYLYVTLIGQRTRWVVKDNGKKTSHMQALVAVAEDPGLNNPPQYYGLMVLVAKGYQTDNLKKAFQSWYQASFAARKLAAGSGKPVLHESLFWVPVGRFGKERQVEERGSGTQKSPIAPIVSRFPDMSGQVGMQHLRTMFVTRPVAEFLKDISVQARDWLNDKDWLSGNDQQAAAPQAADVQPPDAYEEDDTPDWMRDD